MQWVDILLMIHALKGDEVIEIKKNRFNRKERYLQIFVRLFLIVYGSAFIYNSINT
jgi:hypothetical protein